MSADGKVIIDTYLNNDGIETGFKQIESKSTKALSAMKKAVVALGLGKLAKDAVELASDLEEVQNVVDVTFGQGNQKIENFAKNAATAFGMGELAAKQYTGTLGAMLKSMGLTDTAVEDMSTSMVQLAGDMASFYNLDHEEAFTKIRAGISGEVMPLRQLGINMSEVNLQNFAMAQGIEKSYKKMTEAEKVQLRYSYLMSVTADAQGDFARTSDSFANQLRIAQLQLQNTSAELGKELLPLATKGVKVIGELAKSVIPLLSKALKFLLDNAQKLLPVVVSMFTAFKGYRVISSASSAITGFAKSFVTASASMIDKMAASGQATNAQLKLASLFAKSTEDGAIAVNLQTVALSGMHTVMNLMANPLTLVVAGIGALGVAIYNGLSAWREENAITLEQTKALEEQREARQKLIDTEKEEIANQAGEVEYISILADQLYGLADAKGKISKKDVERAKMLAEKLNPALGDMIQLNKDGTATIIQQKDAVEKLIKQKNAQIYLDQMEARYKEALLNVDKQRSDMIATETRLRDAKIERDEAQLKLDEARLAGDQEQIDMWTRKLGAAEQVVQREEKLLEEQSKSYETSTNDIKKYTDMQKAFAEGKYNKVAELYNKEYGVVKANLDNEMEALWQDYQNKEDYYQSLQQLYADGQAGITKEMVDEARKARDAAKTEWNKVGVTGVQAMADGFSTMGKTATTEAGKIAKDMLGKFTGTNVDKWKKVGQNSASGLLSGWQSGRGSLISYIGSTATAMLNKMKSTFGIQSPSKEFAKIGRQDVEGISLGIEKNIPKAEASIEAMANAMMQRARIMDYNGLYIPDLSATIVNNNNNSLTLDGRVVAQSTNKQNRILQLQYGVR